MLTVVPLLSIGCGPLDEGAFVSPRIGLEDGKADEVGTRYATSIALVQDQTYSGKTTRTTTRMTGLSGFVERKGVVGWEILPCRLSLPPDVDSGRRPTIDDKVVRKIALFAPATLVSDDESASFESEVTGAGIGVKLTDPVNDPIPKDGSSSLVVDADDDDNPGITLEVQSPVETVHIYVGARVVLGVTGTVADEERRFTGESGLSLTSVVYGNDKRVFAGNLAKKDAAKQAATTNKRVSDELVMEPVPAAGNTCQEALKRFPL